MGKISLKKRKYIWRGIYKVGKFVPIRKRGGIESWIKSNKVESLAHTFLVYNIKEFLEPLGKVETFIVNKPDLMFTNKKGEEIAIEVETGKSYLINRKGLYNKYLELKKQYGNRLMFVLTDNNYKKRYKNLFENEDNVFLRHEIEGLFKGKKK